MLMMAERFNPIVIKIAISEALSRTAITKVETILKQATAITNANTRYITILTS